MNARPNFLARLRHHQGGVMAIETALVAPVLLMMSIGAFDASRMVARQAEIQSAAGDAAAIVLAKMPTTDAEITTIKNVIKASADLTDSQVTLTRVYRCGTDTAYVTSNASCTNTATITNYIKIHLTATYAPVWTHFGVDKSVNYSVDRTVEIS